MAQWYIYDPDRDLPIYGFSSERGAVVGAMGYVRKFPSKTVSIYKVATYTGILIGKVYMGTQNGHELPKYRTDEGEYLLRPDGRKVKKR